MEKTGINKKFLDRKTGLKNFNRKIVKNFE